MQGQSFWDMSPVKAILIGGIFLVLGIGFFYIFTIHPLLIINQYKNWVPAQCIVKSMNVRTVSGGGSPGRGRTTKTVVDISYKYDYEDNSYIGSRYGFTDNTSSYDNFMIYQPGMRITCFVNPDNPNEAVIDKTMKKARLWWGLLPLGFAGLGIYGIFVGIINRKN